MTIVESEAITIVLDGLFLEPVTSASVRCLSLSQIKSARIDGAVRQAQVDLRCVRRTE